MAIATRVPSRAATGPNGLLAHRILFRSHGSFHAVSGAMNETGRLPLEWRHRYRADQDIIAYTVYSYSTPIAWVTETGHVEIPDVGYSLTTTRHQNNCRAWL